MSTAVKQFHEEEAIGKTYDFQVARRLLRYLRPYLRLLIPALLLTFVLNLLGILQPKFTQYAIDWHILPRKYVRAEVAGWVFTLACSCCGWCSLIFRPVMLNTVGQYVMFDMRRELYDKLQHQEVAYYDRNPVGRIMTRLTSDVDSLNELFTAGITDLLGDLVMIVAIIGVMLVDGRAADARYFVDCADAVGRDHLVSQRRAQRLRHGAHAHRPHQRFSSGTLRRRADGADFQCRNKIAAQVSARSTTTIARQTSTRSFTTPSSFRWLISSAPSALR